MRLSGTLISVGCVDNEVLSGMQTQTAYLFSLRKGQDPAGPEAISDKPLQVLLQTY